MTGSVPLLDDRAATVALPRDRRAAALVEVLGRRCLVLVGLMGCGKTSTGRCLARRLGLDFVDADTEIEWAHRMSVTEIFAKHGEAYFRDGERRVMARLLGEGPKVIATGGGAFINEQTRAAIAARGLAVWLKADLDVLWRRVRRRTHRPLLHAADPQAVLRGLMEQRYPVYGRADITVESHDGPQEAVVEDVLAALEFHLRFSPDVPPLPPRPLKAVAKPAALGAAWARRVAVELPGERAYDILIGRPLLADAGLLLAQLAPGAACMVVTDDNVARHHLVPLQASLEAAGLRHHAVVVRPGEASKSYDTYQAVCDAIIAARLERGDTVVALGGGVVGDLAGFAAATVRRGMRLVQIPTSLLAQVDSAVGGKTGINSPLGKNLVGAFHQPALVIADTGTLDTLPAREFAAGYAEVVKYGLLGDPALFDWLDANRSALFAGGSAHDHLRAEAVARCCLAKAGVVARDERETGERALLNLGHTFGHAFEKLTGYDGARLVHGEGVAVGMAAAFRFSGMLGLCPPADVARVEDHLAAAELPVRPGDVPALRGIRPFDVLDAMRQDKKVERGALTFILVKGIGRAFIARGITGDEVLAFLEDDLKA